MYTIIYSVGFLIHILLLVLIGYPVKFIYYMILRFSIGDQEHARFVLNTKPLPSCIPDDFQYWWSSSNAKSGETPEIGVNDPPPRFA